MAKSIAVWLGDEKNKNDENGENKLELHFNYWSINKKFIRKKTKKNNFIIKYFYKFFLLIKRKCSSSDKVDFLDVGIKFSKVPDNKNINIYFPFSFEKKDFNELGKHISTDVELLSAIFNNDVNHIQLKELNNNYTDIFFKKDGKEEDILRFHSHLEIEDNQNKSILKKVKLEQFEDGCVLTFPNELIQVNEINVDSQLNVYNYIRFRIILNKNSKEAFSKVIKPKDRFFVFRTDSVEVVDFRLNETRNLPSLIKKFLPTKPNLKVHFFIIKGIEEEHLMANTNYKRCRVLEKELWKKYLYCSAIEEIPEVPDMIIYHWAKVESDIFKFSFFSKFRQSEFSVKKLLFFLLVTLPILSIINKLLQLLYDAIYNFF